MFCGCCLVVFSLVGWGCFWLGCCVGFCCCCCRWWLVVIGWRFLLDVIWGFWWRVVVGLNFFWWFLGLVCWCVGIVWIGRFLVWIFLGWGFFYVVGVWWNVCRVFCGCLGLCLVWWSGVWIEGCVIVLGVGLGVLGVGEWRWIVWVNWGRFVWNWVVFWLCFNFGWFCWLGCCRVFVCCWKIFCRICCVVLGWGLVVFRCLGCLLVLVGSWCCVVFWCCVWCGLVGRFSWFLSLWWFRFFVCWLFICCFLGVFWCVGWLGWSWCWVCCSFGIRCFCCWECVVGSVFVVFCCYSGLIMGWVWLCCCWVGVCSCIFLFFLLWLVVCWCLVLCCCIFWVSWDIVSFGVIIVGIICGFFCVLGDGVDCGCVVDSWWWFIYGLLGERCCYWDCCSCLF